MNYKLTAPVAGCARRRAALAIEFEFRRDGLSGLDFEAIGLRLGAILFGCDGVGLAGGELKDGKGAIGRGEPDVLAAVDADGGVGYGLALGAGDFSGDGAPLRGGFSRAYRAWGLSGHKSSDRYSSDSFYLCRRRRMARFPDRRWSGCIRFRGWVLRVFRIWLAGRHRCGARRSGSGRI